MAILHFCFNAIIPEFLIIYLGFFLKKVRILADGFSKSVTDLIFSVSLPTLLFLSLSRSQLQLSNTLGFMGYGVLGTLAMCTLAGVFVPFIAKPVNKGAFLQASFRSNFTVLGLTLSLNLFGPKAVPTLALLFSVVVPLNNILAILMLTHYGQHRLTLKTFVKGVLLNPLVLACLLGISASELQLHLPFIVEKAATTVAALTLPLALLAIGSSLNFNRLRRNWHLTALATAIKLVVGPLILVSGAVALGFRGLELGSLFLLFATPTAVASYIMAKAMGSNSRLSGNIVAVTTLVSVLTLSIGVAVLKAKGLV
ncbi:MAG: AEC family transporter [Candidatus Margulisiibacteriota bacterium]